MNLRDYQQRAIDQLYAWFRENDGHPCLVMPTGAGKSHVIAALCKDAVQNWPETRALMLTHVKELIEQNAEKMRQHWPNAPMGIYSASLRKRQAGEPITFAGIQSIRNKAGMIGHIDLVIVDECHLINHKAEGGYRQLLDELAAINPALRVIGLSATPYRLGHGLITEGEALFDALIEPVTIEELVYKGYLCKLRSKITQEHLSADGVKRRGGEYVEADLQRAVNTDAHNMAVVDEVIRLAGNRKSWLFFCAGVDHSHAVADELRKRGITAEAVTGKTPMARRAEILTAFKAGEIRALTNANVLTTGFDHVGIDLIAMLRPTLSPGLYVQMAGRGLRVSPDKEDCLVLDFAGVVQTHGPITAVQPPAKRGQGEGDPVVKACPNCAELVHAAAKECPACGFAFPEPPARKLKLHDDDIMGLDPIEMAVTGWQWRKHTSRASGKEMLAVSYYGGLSDQPVKEYFPVTHEGYAGQKAVQALVQIATKADAFAALNASELPVIANRLTQAKAPAMIKYKRDGKFHRVLQRIWTSDQAADY